MSLIGLLPQESFRVSAGRACVLGRDLLMLDEDALQPSRGDAVAMVLREPLNAINPSMRIGAG